MARSICCDSASVSRGFVTVGTRPLVDSGAKEEEGMTPMRGRGPDADRLDAVKR